MGTALCLEWPWTSPHPWPWHLFHLAAPDPCPFMSCWGRGKENVSRLRGPLSRISTTKRSWRAPVDPTWSEHRCGPRWWLGPGVVTRVQGQSDKNEPWPVRPAVPLGRRCQDGANSKCQGPAGGVCGETIPPIRTGEQNPFLGSISGGTTAHSVQTPNGLQVP